MCDVISCINLCRPLLVASSSCGRSGVRASNSDTKLKYEEVDAVKCVLWTADTMI